MFSAIIRYPIINNLTDNGTRKFAAILVRIKILECIYLLHSSRDDSFMYILKDLSLLIVFSSVYLIKTYHPHKWNTNERETVNLSTAVQHIAHKAIFDELIFESNPIFSSLLLLFPFSSLLSHSSSLLLSIPLSSSLILFFLLLHLSFSLILCATLCQPHLSVHLSVFMSFI